MARKESHNRPELRCESSRSSEDVREEVIFAEPGTIDDTVLVNGIVGFPMSISATWDSRSGRWCQASSPSRFVRRSWGTHHRLASGSGWKGPKILPSRSGKARV